MLIRKLPGLQYTEKLEVKDHYIQPPHPNRERAGMAMRLLEADGGCVTRERAARRALTSSSRGSVAAGLGNLISGLRSRSGLLSADTHGTQR